VSRRAVSDSARCRTNLALAPHRSGLAATLAIDLVLSRLPYIVTDVAWTLLFALVYVLFALVWWASGRAAETPIYAFLDFDKPSTLWIVVALAALAMLADVAMLGVAVFGRAIAGHVAQCKCRGAAAYRPLNV
jgi:phage shock protein PspC (stress-responsive transcriptional regulator)